MFANYQWRISCSAAVLFLILFALLIVYTGQPYTPYRFISSRFRQNGNTSKQPTVISNVDESSFSCENYSLSYDWPDLNNITCHKLRRNYTRTVSKEEKSMPLAFTLKVYHQAEQVEALFRSIWRPTNFYCFHVDKSSSESFQWAIRRLVSCFENAFISSEIVPVSWGSYSALLADVLCMRDLVNSTFYGKWMYLINLTGEEMPLKTMREIAMYLKDLNGRNVISHIKSPPYNNYRFNKRYVYEPSSGDQHEAEGKHMDLPLPAPAVICKGDVAGVFSRKFVNYLINNDLAKELLKFLSESATPDEHFWTTLNCNENLKVPGGFTGSLTSMDEKRASLSPIRSKWWADQREGPYCRHQFRRTLCVFTLAELPKLFQTAGYSFFANKFDLQLDRRAIKCVEQYIWFRQRHSANWNLTASIRAFLADPLVRHNRQDGL